jgi:hypothetical protein
MSTNPVGSGSPPRVYDINKRPNDFATLRAMQNCATKDMAKLYCTGIINRNSTFTGLKPEEISGPGGLLAILTSWREDSRFYTIKAVVVTAIEIVENWVPKTQTVPGLGVPTEILAPEIRLDDLLRQGQAAPAEAAKRTTTLTGIGETEQPAPVDKAQHDLEQRVLEAGRDLETTQSDLARNLEERRLDAARMQELEGEVARVTGQLSGSSSDLRVARQEIETLQAQLQVYKTSAAVEGETPAIFLEVNLTGLRRQATTQSELVAEKRRGLAATLEENQKGLGGLITFRDLKQTELQQKQEALRHEKELMDQLIAEQESLKEAIQAQAERDIQTLLDKRKATVQEKKKGLKDSYLEKSPALGNIAAALEKYLEIDPKMVAISNIYEPQISEIKQTAQRNVAGIDRNIAKIKQDFEDAKEAASAAEASYAELDRMLGTDIKQRETEVGTLQTQSQHLQSIAEKIAGILANIDKYDETAASIRKAVENATAMLNRIIETING